MEGRAASWELFFADADKEAAVLPGSTLARLDADIPDSSVAAGGIDRTIEKEIQSSWLDIRSAF
jgi:hypothetical protein